jgi:hypothetical protein
MGWLVNATPRPLYPRERLGTHCIGGWVGPRAGLDRYGKSRPHWDPIPGPDRPARSKSLYRQLSAPCGVSLFEILSSVSVTSVSGHLKLYCGQNTIYCFIFSNMFRPERPSSGGTRIKICTHCMWNRNVKTSVCIMWVCVT